VNSDIWPTAVSPFFDLGLKGRPIEGVVSWGRGNEFHNASGELTADIETSGNLFDATFILSGDLNVPPPAYPGAFQPMKLEIRKHGRANAVVTVTNKANGHSKVLDDAFCAYPWWRHTDISWIFQVYPDEAEYVDMWLQGPVEMRMLLSVGMIREYLDTPVSLASRGSK